MWFHDLETLRFLDVNEAAVQSYGYSREEFLQMTLLDIRPEEDRAKFLCHIRGTDSHLEQSGYWRHLRKDGSLILVEISAYRQVIGGREVELVLASNVTDKVHAEEAMMRSEASFRSFVDNAPYGIFRSHTSEDRFLEINPAFVRLLGYESADELLRVKISEAIYDNPDDRFQVVQMLQEKGFLESLQLTFRKKSGEPIQVQISGRSCCDAESLFEGFLEDVTEKKHLEEQLRQSQKMDAVGRLAGGIAHDFNNMLTAVIGYSDMLAGSDGLNERQERQVLQISKAAHRAAGLTQQLLAFSRQQVLQPVIIDINSAIEETLQMIKRLLGESIIVHFETKPPVPLVFVDPSQITQIMMNLCLNARDAMPQGGYLTITAEAVSAEDHVAGVPVSLLRKPHVQIKISDTGLGMTPEVQAKIFEPFFTTKGLGKGTGLGLATVYGLVQQSGGHISVASELGIGSCFTVYLPAAEETGATIPDGRGDFVGQ
jgi:PAS domain S-box-containing protein